MCFNPKLRLEKLNDFIKEYDIRYGREWNNDKDLYLKLYDNLEKYLEEFSGKSFILFFLIIKNFFLVEK